MKAKLKEGKSRPQIEEILKVMGLIPEEIQAAFVEEQAQQKGEVQIEDSFVTSLEKGPETNPSPTEANKPFGSRVMTLDELAGDQPKPDPEDIPIMQIADSVPSKSSFPAKESKMTQIESNIQPSPEAQPVQEAVSEPSLPVQELPVQQPEVPAPELSQIQEKIIPTQLEPPVQLTPPVQEAVSEPVAPEPVVPIQESKPVIPVQEPLVSEPVQEPIVPKPQEVQSVQEVIPEPSSPVQESAVSEPVPPVQAPVVQKPQDFQSVQESKPVPVQKPILSGSIPLVQEPLVSEPVQEPIVPKPQEVQSVQEVIPKPSSPLQEAVSEPVPPVQAPIVPEPQEKPQSTSHSLEKPLMIGENQNVPSMYKKEGQSSKPSTPSSSEPAIPQPVVEQDKKKSTKLMGVSALKAALLGGGKPKPKPVQEALPPMQATEPAKPVPEPVQEPQQSSPPQPVQQQTDGTRLGVVIEDFRSTQKKKVTPPLITLAENKPFNGLPPDQKPKNKSKKTLFIVFAIIILICIGAGALIVLPSFMGGGGENTLGKPVILTKSVSAFCDKQEGKIIITNRASENIIPAEVKLTVIADGHSYEDKSTEPIRPEETVSYDSTVLTIPLEDGLSGVVYGENIPVEDFVC